MPVEREITSPRDLLTSIEQVREALFLTYTSNLAFFERFALQELRSRGAVVTVVSDASAAYVDPRDVRSAGRQYLDGRAACRKGGRFHPKLIVIAGDSEIVAAIGSGNVTMSGWHQNAEIWTVMQGDHDGVPTAIRELAPWLRGLPSEVAFSPGVEAAFARVGETISQFPDAQTGPHLISSLREPIADQLPRRDQLDGLIVSAPFFDPQAAALSRICDQLQASEVQVALQPHAARFDGATLADSFERIGAEASEIAGKRYHHGKLIEWHVDGRFTALTGSPNISVAALLRAMSEGGNCELALLGDGQESIAPATGPIVPSAEIRQHAYPDTGDDTEALPALLAVIVSVDGATLHLAAPLEAAGVVEVLGDDRWQAQAEAPAMTPEISIGIASPGTAVRVRVGELATNVVVVCDLAAVLRRRISHTGRVRTDPDAMFRDLGIPDQFLEDLEELRPHLPSSAPAAPVIAPAAPPDGKCREPETGWEEYLEACAAQIGDPMLSFALGMPRLFGQTGLETALPDDPGMLDTDTPQEAASEEQLAPIVRNFQLTATERERERIGRFCVRLADISPKLVPVGQLITLRLLLRLIAGKLWGEPSAGAASWVPLLQRATIAAASGETRFDAVAHARGSLVALSLAVIRGQVQSFSPYTVDPYRGVYEEVERASLAVVGSAIEEQISVYSAELLDDLGPTLQARAVMALVAEAGSLDPLDSAIRIAKEEMGLEMSREGRLLSIENELPRPLLRSLLRALRVAEDLCPIAVEGETPNERGTLIWDRPNLVIMRQIGGRKVGSIYNMTWPGMFADAELPNPRAEWTGDEIPNEVADLLAKLDAEL